MRRDIAAVGVAIGIVGLGVSLSTVARAETEPPPLSQALATARAEHKVLVAEFSTSWCEPCRYMAERVLPNPLVQAALARVVFVQYDAERGPGPEAAARLRPDGFPTIVAVGEDGRQFSRVVGVREVPALVAWLREVAAPRPAKRSRHRHSHRAEAGAHSDAGPIAAAAQGERPRAGRSGPSSPLVRDEARAHRGAARGS